MNIMVSLHKAENLQLLKDLKVTHIIVNDECFASGIDGLAKDQLANDIKEIHNAGLKAVIKADRLYDQSELKDLEEYLVFVNDCKADMVLFSDVTIKTLVDKLHLSLECVYAPETLLTNKFDVEQLRYDNFDSCVISKDIPLEDVYDIAEYNDGYCYLRVHGPILISYSKRRFISVYFGQEKEYKDKYYLQEESRTVKLPIVEKQKGSWVYGYTLESFEEIKTISEKPFKGIIIDNMLQDDKYTLRCVELYSAVLNKKMSAEEALDALKAIDDAIEYTSINEIRRTFLEKE